MFSFPSILLAIALMTVRGRGVDKAIIAIGIGIVSISQYTRIEETKGRFFCLLACFEFDR